MQSTAPSTPPQQQDLNKMNQPPSQTMYVPSGGANGTTNIRQTQQNMFRGGSSGSGQRAPRHSIPLQPGPFISQQMPPMMVQPPSYHAQYTTQRQPTSQMFPPSQQYQLQQASFPANYTSYPSYISYPIQQQQRSVGVPSGIVQAGAPGLGGPNAAQQHIPMQSNNMLTTIPTAATATGSNTLNNKKRRRYAIKIIDPITNRNILDEIETAKSHQSGTSITPDVGYAESLGHTVDVIGGPMHGIAEANSTVSEPLMSGVNLATSNANNAQGTFIDLMNQHKISAVVPPTTQPPSSVLVINESLNQTPVVSAISDGPSVEIPPKQQSSKSKRTKSNDAIQQQQPDKMSDTKELSLISQQLTGAKTAEETSDNSLKNTSRQSASPLPSQVDPSSKENHIVELTNQTKNAYDDNQHQNIPAISTQRLKQLEQSQSVSNSGANDSITSDAAITSTQPDDSFNKGTGLTVSQHSGELLSSDLGSATQFLPAYKENNKKNTNNIQSITSASNNNVSKNSREKDKNQQASSSNNNSSVVVTRSANDTTTEQIASTNYSSNTSSSIQTNNRLVSVLNNSNQTKGEKMKINDKTDISSAVVSNKVIPNTNVSEKNNNKKISDKNDNIIPSKSSHQNQKHQRQSQQRTVTAKESQQQQSDSVSSNYNSNFSGSTKTSSLCPPNQPSTWNKPDVDTSKSNQNTIMNLMTSIPVTSKASQIDVSIDELDRASLPTVTAVNKGCFVNETSSADLNNSDEFETDSSKKTFESTSNNIDVKIKSPDVKTDALSDKNSNLIEEEPLSELQTKEEHEPCKINSHDSDCKKLDISKSFNQEHLNEKSGSNSQLPDQPNETVKSKDEQESSSLIPAQISNGSNKVESSPISSNAPKSYGREQLLELRYAPLSQSKPKVNNPALFILEIGVKPSQQNLMPSFARGPSGKRQLSNSGISLSSGNSAGGHQFLKQSSMSGVNAKSNAKGSKSGLIHVSLSLREDVKLNETENAWRPTRLKRDDNVPEAERSKEELLRKVRGILNKLTPEKFNTLVDQLMKLQIDTQDKINGVMILVFEKAIDEPNFSVSYARLCLHLAENKLASEVKKDGPKVGSDGKVSNMVLFKCALLDKTQREFTDNVLERKAKEQKLKPLIEKLKDCTDPEKRLEIKEILEEEDRKIRRRSGGTVRFIGELFKINMLTAKIIRDCIKNLLEPSSEDKLECLCKLLTTVGDRLEQMPTPKEAKNWSLDNVFKKMQGIVDRKSEWSKQISSRVRFMLQDVIDLRKNKWQSKRNDMNPKTMEQIQKEAENEQYNNQLINSTALPSKKEERRYTGIGAGNSNNVSSNNSGVSGNSNTGSGGYYKGNRQQSSNDAEIWYTKTSKGSRVIDPTKLGQICTDYGSKINEERRLGDSAQFQWNRVKDSQKPTTTTSNSFAPLSNLDLGRGSNNGPRNRGSYTKSSMERDRYEGRNSRGGSINGSRENSVSRSSVRSSNASRSTGTSHTYSVSSAHPSSSRSEKVDVPTAVLAATVEPTISQKAVLNKFNDDPTKRLEEVINEMVTTAIEVSFSEAVVVGETIPECYRSDFIKIILSSYLHLSKTKEQHREKAAEIVLELYNKKFLTLDHILKGYEQFSMDASDIYIDVPELWKYVFQFIGPLLSEGVISLKHLWNENLVDANMSKVFFKHLFMYCTQEIGPNFTRKMWHTSELSWQTCFNKDDHVQFIKHNNFEFIDANDAPCPVYGEPNMPKILAKIEKLLKGNKSEDLITDYINGNIKAPDKSFIRGLTTIVLENALIRSERGTKLDTKKFNKSYGVPLLQRYIDSKEEFELECLYAIQVLIHRLEYPQGLLFEIFWALFEHDAICQDAFIKWRDSPEERAAGKGVAVKGLNKFFELIIADSTDENN